MGNLNQFYLMGRLAKAPEAGTVDERAIVNLTITPGTGQRSPRGPVESLQLEAHGPQVETAMTLRVGQGVLLRGQLRQELRGDAPRLVARVQAIELIVGGGGPPRPPRADDDAGAEEGEGGLRASGRRPRRRRRRGGRGEGRPEAGGERGAREGASEGGDAAAEGAAPPPKPEPLPPPRPLPPPKPIAPVTDAPAPPPDPTYSTDMPF